jgi:hypothetical protein
MLALTAAVVVIEHDPVFRFPGSVCTRGIRIERRVLAAAALRVKDRQPRLARRIETAWCDQAKLACGRFVSVFAVDIQEFGDWWRRSRTGNREADASEAVCQ